ncbi:hypothetical protein HZC31_07095 [Candidatus Woesearchaeota archaeon]|nr:hypothetical protein [Candidatus Woesearchaeota archaeon]
MANLSLITQRLSLFGRKNDHLLFGKAIDDDMSYSEKGNYEFVRDDVRRVDVEVTYLNSWSETDLDIRSCQLIKPPYKEVYFPFHSCGGRIDTSTTEEHIKNEYSRISSKYGITISGRMAFPPRELELMIADGPDAKKHKMWSEETDNIKIPVEELTCLRCHESLYVFINGNALANVFADTLQPAVNSFRFGPGSFRSPFGGLHSQITGFSRKILDELYRKRSNTSFESLLEQLFPNMPPSIMEELLRETIGNIDATIFSLEREVMLDSFGYSHADAVGRFTISNPLSEERYVFKIVKERHAAERELLIAEAATRSPLAQYIVHFNTETPLSYKGYHLLVMPDLSDDIFRIDPVRHKIYQSVGGKQLSPILKHRLYVASLFHTHLKHLAGHPAFEESEVPQYYSARDLRNKLASSFGERKATELISSNLNESIAFLVTHNVDGTRIVHNDMRAQNWTGRQGHILIDYGNATRADKGGGIYRDIVRILLAEQKRFVFNTSYIRTALEFYYAVRHFHEPEQAELTQQNYALTLASLHVEAYRAMYIASKTMPHHQCDSEIERCKAIAQFAEKEALRVLT